MADLPILTITLLTITTFFSGRNQRTFRCPNAPSPCHLPRCLWQQLQQALEAPAAPPIEERVWEGQQVLPMPAGAAATNSAASGRGMGRSGIEMPVFSALISCDRRVRVGGAAGASNACRGCCHKQRRKWQGDGAFGHRNACIFCTDQLRSKSACGRGSRCFQCLPGLLPQTAPQVAGGWGVRASKCLYFLHLSVAIEECVWEGQQVPPMPAGAAATNSAASGRGMGRSGIEMPVFSALISCDRRARVGGAAAASNACRGCCHKQHGKWQGDGAFGHRNACIFCTDQLRSKSACGRGSRCFQCLPGLLPQTAPQVAGGWGVRASKCLYFLHLSVAIEECVWEGQQVPPMPAGAAATNSAASGRGMGRSGIEMPVFSALISCDRRARVGGAAGASNACRSCCHKQRRKWQGDGAFGHRNACIFCTDQLRSKSACGRGSRCLQCLPGLLPQTAPQVAGGWGVRASKCLYFLH